MLKLKSIKKSIAFLMLWILFLTVPGLALAQEHENICISQTILQLDDEKIPVSVYKITDIDYVPLAAIINYFGMKAEFHSNSRHVVFQYDDTINTKKEYYNILTGENHAIIDSPHVMEFNGNKFSVQSMKLVDGYNFMPVAALDDFFGYKLLYDKIPNTVVMSRDYYNTLDNSTMANYSQFMKENVIDFTTDDMTPLKTIDFENYNVYLVGENHAISKNTDIQLSFIKFLHKSYGVRFVISELGYCDSIIENEFLKTGDKSLLNKRIESVRGTFGYTKENYDFYTKLYDYNQTLPENDRIVLIGIDVQHNWREGLEVIKPFLNNSKEMSAEVKAVSDIINKEGLTHTELKSALDIISKDNFKFKQYLSENYLNFWFGIRSIWQSMVFYDNDDFSVREQFIHENMRDIYTELGMNKCFGMFGGSHTRLDGMFDEDKSIANYLNTEFQPTKNKVLSIMCMYENSYYMGRGTGNSFPVEPNYGKTLNRTLADAVKGEVGICSTGQIPFEEGKLSDMFQYMLCIKNSPASKPYGDLNEK